jgi:ABC-type phosphate/phosphonate transport system permease subunit
VPGRPLGFLSARNVPPGAVSYPARGVLNFFRSVDTLVYALVSVAAVGLGPFPPGVLAIVASTTISLAKRYGEAVEGVDPGRLDAITATGGTRLQVYLRTHLRMIDHRAASAVLRVPVAMVMVVDAISSRRRDWLV